MPVIFWNPTLATEQIIQNAGKRIEQAGNMFAIEIRKSLLRQRIWLDKDRPVYRTGKNAGKYWTARKRMGLLKSVRVVKQGEGIYQNVWIMCGNTKAYYAKIVEHYTPFFRPAISKNRYKARKILAHGRLGS